MRKQWLRLLIMALLSVTLLVGCLEEDLINKTESSTSTTSSDTKVSDLPNDSDTSDTESNSTADDTSSPDSDAHVHKPEGNACTNNGDTHSFTCTECGEVVTEEHNYIIPVPYSDEGHLFQCQCGHRGSGEVVRHSLVNARCERCGWALEHDHEYGYLPGKNTDEEHTKYCTICSETVVELHHLEFMIDENEHYQYCSCGYMTNEGEHTMNENSVCTVCGFQAHVCEYTSITFDDTYHYFMCECGSKSWTNHTYYSHIITTTDAVTHTIKCDYCDFGLVENHVYDSLNRCSVCQQDRPNSEGLDFEAVDGGYCLIGIGSCKDTAIRIPAEYNGQPVVAIGSSAFEGNESIVVIVIPETVKSIGSSAFAGCASLQEINLPESMTTIRDNTFMGCTSLKTMNLPKKLTEIEMFAFLGCSSFQGFDDYSQFTLIGDYAFSDCTSLSGTIHLLGNEEICEVTIGNGAFEGCTSITELVFHTDILHLGGGAFMGCSSLKTVAFAIPCLEYGFDIDTFADCTSLETITFVCDEEAWMLLLADSIVDEEMGMSWYEGSGNFTVIFEDPIEDTQKAMTIDELYRYIEEHYWQ